MKGPMDCVTDQNYLLWFETIVSYIHNGMKMKPGIEI